MEPVIEMYFFRGGYLGLCPIEDGSVNAAALLSRSEFAKAGKSVLSILEAAVQRNRRLAARLAAAVPSPGTQAAIAPVYLQRKPAPWDGFPRLGDSAAMIAPLCGDGMSMALRSAALCAPLADSYLRGNLSLQDWEQRFTQAILLEFADLYDGERAAMDDGQACHPTAAANRSRLRPCWPMDSCKLQG